MFAKIHTLAREVPDPGIGEGAASLGVRRGRANIAAGHGPIRADAIIG
jgi:hypothetical protein